MAGNTTYAPGPAKALLIAIDRLDSICPPDRYVTPEKKLKRSSQAALSLAMAKAIKTRMRGSQPPLTPTVWMAWRNATLANIDSQADPKGYQLCIMRLVQMARKTINNIQEPSEKRLLTTQINELITRVCHNYSPTE